MTPHAERALSLRSLVLLASIVVLLIAGLLGMHVLGGSASGHGAHGAGRGSAATAVVAEHATEHAEHAATTGVHALDTAPAAEAVHCLGDCADVGPQEPGHAELMACVLALLAGLLVLVPPGRLSGSWLRVAMLPARRDASAVLLVPPPPSLTLLSISRT